MKYLIASLFVLIAGCGTVVDTQCDRAGERVECDFGAGADSGAGSE